MSIFYWSFCKNKYILRPFIFIVGFVIDAVSMLPLGCSSMLFLIFIFIVDFYVPKIQHDEIAIYAFDVLACIAFIGVYELATVAICNISGVQTNASFMRFISSIPLSIITFTLMRTVIDFIAKLFSKTIFTI